MAKKFLSLCIDLEEFNLPWELGGDISEEDKYRISFQGAQLLYNLLDSLQVKATFFCTENMAVAFPELLKSLMKSGHEIALHNITVDDSHDLVNELQRQKSTIETIIESKIYGCRSHRFIHVPSGVLKAVGLVYDNSLHPTYVPGRYFNIFHTRSMYIENGIIEIPISVVPLFRLPFSWVWFRNLGLGYAKFCSNLVCFDQEHVNIYFHSWDFASVNNWPLKWRYKLLIRRTGDKMARSLRQYLNWCIQKNITTVTIFDYLNITGKV